jgi:hypothetical protein
VDGHGAYTPLASGVRARLSSSEGASLELAPWQQPFILPFADTSTTSYLLHDLNSIAIANGSIYTISSVGST